MGVPKRRMHQINTDGALQKEKRRTRKGIIPRNSREKLVGHCKRNAAQNQY